MAYIKESEWNCGILTLSGIGNHTTTRAVKKVLSDATGDKDKYERNAYDWLSEHDLTLGGYILATTNDSEKKGARALARAGFRALTRFKNPNTGKFITLWGAPTPKK
jgi:hypothetical protein